MKRTKSVKKRMSYVFSFIKKHVRVLTILSALGGMLAIMATVQEVFGPPIATLAYDKVIVGTPETSAFMNLTFFCDKLPELNYSFQLHVVEKLQLKGPLFPLWRTFDHMIPSAARNIIVEKNYLEAISNDSRSDGIHFLATTEFPRRAEYANLRIEYDLPVIPSVDLSQHSQSSTDYTLIDVNVVSHESYPIQNYWGYVRLMGSSPDSPSLPSFGIYKISITEGIHLPYRIEIIEGCRAIAGSQESYEVNLPFIIDLAPRDVKTFRMNISRGEPGRIVVWAPTRYVDTVVLERSYRSIDNGFETAWEGLKSKRIGELNLTVAVQRNELVNISLSPNQDTEPGKDYIVHVYCYEARSGLVLEKTIEDSFRLTWTSDEVSRSVVYSKVVHLNQLLLQKILRIRIVIEG